MPLSPRAWLSGIGFEVWDASALWLKNRESSSTEKAQMAVITATLTADVSCAHENLNKAGVTALCADKEANEKFSEYVPRSILDWWIGGLMDWVASSQSSNLPIFTTSLRLLAQRPTPASRNQHPCQPTGAGAGAGGLASLRLKVVDPILIAQIPQPLPPILSRPSHNNKASVC
jgi:hypothetical protein